jgi:hypothetical protein
MRPSSRFALRPNVPFPQLKTVGPFGRSTEGNPEASKPYRPSVPMGGEGQAVTFCAYLPHSRRAALAAQRAAGIHRDRRGRGRRLILRPTTSNYFSPLGVDLETSRSIRL